MVIGIDSTPLSNPLTGGGRYALQILRYIARNPAARLQFYGRQPAPSVRSEFPHVPYYAQTQGNTLWYGATLPRLLKQNGCNSFWGFPLPYVKVRGVHYVSSILDVYFVHLPRVEEWPLMRRLQTLPQWLLSYWATWRTVQVADHVLVISQATGRDLERYFRLKTWQLAPPAPDIIPLASEKAGTLLSHQGIPYILAVGGFQPHRNRERLLRAWALAAVQQSTNMHLVIVGRFQHPPQEEYFRKLCQELAIDRQVQFVPNASDEELTEWYRFAQALIHPTLCEGFGMPVVEALAFGKPVAISWAGSLPEVAGGLEVLQFDPGSIHQMAAALVTLWNAPVSPSEVVENRQGCVRKFSWQASGKMTAELLMMNRS